jgi:hypothetical protein
VSGTSPRASRPLGRILFIASGAIPLLGLCGTPADTMLLIYSVFVIAWVLRERARAPGSGLRRRVWLRYFLSMVLVGFLTEVFAWTSNYLGRAEEPALLHPQLLYDLVLSPGIYAAWAVGWILLTKRWGFSVAEIFLLQGVYGVFVEQQGAILLQGWQVLPLGALLWLYVFVVYGSAAGIAYLPYENDLYTSGSKTSIWKYPAALAVQFVATVVVAVGWALLLGAMGVSIPDPKPIWEAPLW